MNIHSYRSIGRGSLLGFAEVELDGGLVLHGVGIFEKDGRRWANPPGKPRLDRDQKPVRGAGGRIEYDPVVSFATKSQRDAFSETVVAGLVAAGHLPSGSSP
ncbi:MAG: hypothetical protein AAFX81_01830 [Pseudomonadota bacterium]